MYYECERFIDSLVLEFKQNIEPMINEGSPDFFIDEENGWTVYTEDDGLSAQIEYMVLITEDGVEVLTK